MAEVTALYRKLPSDARRFRLLTIIPSADVASTIECSLAEHSIDDAEYTYDALSYCWGDAGTTVPIIVDGHERQVTVNLDDALRQFRSDSFPSPMIIWADALCINQKDELERGHQVKLMGDIYRKASKVRAWLGRGDQVEGRGLRAIQHMSRPRCTDGSRDPKESPHERYDSIWEEICELPFVLAVCNAPYWRRVWVVQELVLNDNVTLHSGARRGVVRCWMCLITAIDSCSYDSEDNWCSNICPSAFDCHIQIFDSFKLIESAKRLLTQRQHQGGTELVLLLLHSRKKLVTNELDRIYGLLGLLEEYLDVDPDYSNTTEGLYEAVVMQVIQKTGSLEILEQGQQSGSRTAALPSWVPDFREPAHPFPGPDFDENPEYRDILIPQNQFTPWSPCRGVLGVFGARFDIVKEVIDLPPYHIYKGQEVDLSNHSYRSILAQAAKGAFSTMGGFLGQLRQTPQVGDQVCILVAQLTCLLFVLRTIPSTTRPAYSLVGGCTIWRDWDFDQIVKPSAAARLISENSDGYELGIRSFFLV